MLLRDFIVKSRRQHAEHMAVQRELLDEVRGLRADLAGRPAAGTVTSSPSGDAGAEQTPKEAPVDVQEPDTKAPDEEPVTEPAAPAVDDGAVEVTEPARPKPPRNRASSGRKKG